MKKKGEKVGQFDWVRRLSLLGKLLTGGMCERIEKVPGKDYL